LTALISRLRNVLRVTRTTPEVTLTLFVLAVISMGGFMFHPTIGIDDEQTLFAPSNGGIGWFNQGRFLIGLIQLLIPQAVTPLFPYLLLASAYVASYTLILSIHGLHHNWKSGLSYLIFILFPANWLSQEFMINVPGFALGLFFVCLAASITHRQTTDPLLPRSGFSVSPWAIVLLVLAIGGFQSLITLYLAIGAGSLLFELSRDQDAFQQLGRLKGVLAKLGSWITTSILAVAAHSFLFKLYLGLSHTQVHQIDRYFRSPYFMLRTQPAQYIAGNIDQFFRTYLSPGIFYGHSLWAFTGLVALLPLLMLLKRFFQSNQKDTSQAKADQFRDITMLILVAFLLAAPLSLNIISQPYRIPMRALMALPYVAWLSSMIWLEANHAFKPHPFHKAGILLSAILVIQCLISTSNYYGSRAFNFRSDQLVAATIMANISQAPTANGKTVTRFLSQGFLERSNPYRTAMYSTAGSSFFNWDNGNNDRMVKWLKAMGISGLEAVPDKEARRFQNDFAAMQSWPSPGSIMVKDDTVLVKFSPAKAGH
jgi:hypothetical protein